MTKNEYLDELRRRLVRLPKDDRDDVITYYSEYFEDAGSDEEAIASLGSATKLAAVITADFSTRMLVERKAAQNPQRDSDKPYAAPPKTPVTKNPYAVQYTALAVETPPPAIAAGGNPYFAHQQTAQAENGSPAAAYTAAPADSAGHSSGSLRWIWYVVLGIFALPVALPIAIAIVAVMIALVTVCFALVVALIAIVVAVIVASILILFTSPAGFMLSWGSGLLVLGSALVLLGIAMLLVPLFIRLGILLIHGIGKFFSWIFRKLKGSSENNETK